MRKIIISIAICLFLISASAVPGSAALKGDYIEARSADVYTGPCFANSEVGLTGQEAILAWKVQEGDWKGDRPERTERGGGGQSQGHAGRSLPRPLSGAVRADCGFPRQWPPA